MGYFFSNNFPINYLTRYLSYLLYISMMYLLLVLLLIDIAVTCASGFLLLRKDWPSELPSVTLASQSITDTDVPLPRLTQMDEAREYELEQAYIESGIWRPYEMME